MNCHDQVLPASTRPVQGRICGMAKRNQQLLSPRVAQRNRKHPLVSCIQEPHHCWNDPSVTAVGLIVLRYQVYGSGLHRTTLHWYTDSKRFSKKRAGSEEEGAQCTGI